MPVNQTNPSDLFNYEPKHKISDTSELIVLTFPRQQILDSSNLKEFADGNSKFDENGRKLRAISPFPTMVFKRLVLQTHKNQDLFWKGLRELNATQWIGYFLTWCKLLLQTKEYGG